MFKFALLLIASIVGLISAAPVANPQLGYSDPFFYHHHYAVPHGQHFTHEVHESHYGVPFAQHHVLSAPVYSGAYVAQPVGYPVAVLG